MGRPAGWMKELQGLSPMKSPGAPSVRREVEREYWREIATGVTSEDAAIAVGELVSSRRAGCCVCVPKRVRWSPPQVPLRPGPYAGPMGNSRSDTYFALSTEGSWIDRLRARLPYSFETIRVSNTSSEEPHNRTRRYVVSGPVLQEGPFSAERHNFWRRGHVFYMIGKLIDCHSMEQIWRGYRMKIGLLRLKYPGDLSGSTALEAFEFYNSMQLEKVWHFVLGNHLDRERVMMTNITQSLELCLKAMITHASHLETGRFEFPEGHKIRDLYEALPAPLRHEITEESRVFADAYTAYRSHIENEVRALSDQHIKTLINAQSAQDERDQWESVAADLNDSDYTAFLNANDPGINLDQQRDVWLRDALDQIGDTNGFGDEMQYYRYAPAKDIDKLPTIPISLALLLGRFFYEHLFPMPTDPQTPITTHLLE